MSRIIALIFLVACAAAPRALFAVSISTVPVRNAGNGNSVYGRGAVDYEYRIGKYEVTVGQYTEFLNAVARTDPYGLYNTQMATYLNSAGIQRNGISGSYSYSAIGSSEHPVTFVDWGDAARFVNWLHNGQPTGTENAGTTERGAYQLDGAITNEALLAVARLPTARWFIPTDGEWYKAAYHKNDGPTANYWRYATSSDTQPYSDEPPGADAPTASNTANIRLNDGIANQYNDGYAVTGSNMYSDTQNYLTDVGAYPLTTSAYGAYDMIGNVHEWKEDIGTGSWAINRLQDGGSFDGGWDASVGGGGRPDFGFRNLGFRVATIVPEPSSIALAVFGLASLIAYAYRRRNVKGCGGAR